MEVDVSLLTTIGLIFAVTLIGAYLRTTVKDPCLRSFAGFHVTLERTNGKLVWGVLRLESTGMELIYKDAVQDEKHLESSYALYSSEYSDIQAIYRYADNLTPESAAKRERDISRSFHPGPIRRLGRQVANFLRTATDSLNEVMNLLLGRAQKLGGRYLAEKGDAVLGRLGGKVLGQVGGTYDPLLEGYIGQRVVLELLEGNEVHEHVGIFKNYSPDFLEILDVQFPLRQTVAVKAEDQLEARQLAVSAQGDVIRVHNRGETPVLIQSVRTENGEQLVNVVVDGDEVVEIHPTAKFDKADLRVQTVRELDIIAPRTRAVVRHRAEHYQPEAIKDVIFDIVFDVGLAFKPDDRDSALEARLRRDLDEDPNNALAAANLGALLLKQASWVEAEKWLCLALNMTESLPDGGKRARMQLRELQRRHLQEMGRVV